MKERTGKGQMRGPEAQELGLTRVGKVRAWRKETIHAVAR
jgi:hypothetical protein